MKDNFSRPTYMGVGAASVIMIFVVLCLTALSVLSLTGARTAEKSASRRSEAVCAYYEAAFDAQVFLAEASDKAFAGELQPGEVIAKEIPFGTSQVLSVAVEASSGGTARFSAHSVRSNDFDTYEADFYEFPDDIPFLGGTDEMLFLD